MSVSLQDRLDSALLRVGNASDKQVRWILGFAQAATTELAPYRDDLAVLRLLGITPPIQDEREGTIGYKAVQAVRRTHFLPEDIDAALIHTIHAWVQDLLRKRSATFSTKLTVTFTTDQGMRPPRAHLRQEASSVFGQLQLRIVRLLCDAWPRIVQCAQCGQRALVKQGARFCSPTCRTGWNVTKYRSKPANRAREVMLRKRRDRRRRPKRNQAGRKRA